MAKHFAITPDHNNQPIKMPLKTWVRQNQTDYPQLDPNERTTGHIRRALIAAGWQRIASNEEVILIRPDTNNSHDYASTIVDLLDEEDINEQAVEELEELSFSLEKDLQSALRRNITSLQPGLTIIDNGVEKNTTAGRIDITTRDANGAIVVIELKAGKAKPDVIAQILAYITAIKNEGHANVRGVIVAQEFSDRVKLAAEATELIELVEYGFQFSFNRF